VREVLPELNHFPEKTVWEGIVEVFDLAGHATALPEEPNGEVFVGDQKTFSETHIGPKEPRDTGHVSVAESAIPVDPKDVSHQYFWGWMVYGDVFNRLHLSEFCWNLTGTRLTTDGRDAEFSTKACQASQLQRRILP
jgi:hypothetical protein